MGRGRPKGSKTKFRIKEVRPICEEEKFSPIAEAIKMFRDSNDKWLKIRILENLSKYLYGDKLTINPSEFDLPSIVING